MHATPSMGILLNIHDIQDDCASTIKIARYSGRLRFHNKDSFFFVNVNNAAQEDDSQSSMTSSSPSNGLGYGFTKAQYQSLLGLLH